jgi:hypothetical protein
MATRGLGGCTAAFERAGEPVGPVTVSCKSLRVSSEGLGGQAGPDIAARGPEVVVLPDEPYRFGPETFPGQPSPWSTAGTSPGTARR